MYVWEMGVQRLGKITYYMGEHDRGKVRTLWGDFVLIHVYL